MVKFEEYLASRNDLKNRVCELRKTLKINRRKRRKLKDIVIKRDCRPEFATQLARTRQEIDTIRAQIAGLKEEKDDQLIKHLASLHIRISELRRAEASARSAAPSLTPSADMDDKLLADDMTGIINPDDSAQVEEDADILFRVSLFAASFLKENYKKSTPLEYMPLELFCTHFEEWGVRQPGWEMVAHGVCLKVCEQVLKENKFVVEKNARIVHRGQRIVGDCINAIARISK